MPYAPFFIGGMGSLHQEMQYIIRQEQKTLTVKTTIFVWFHTSPATLSTTLPTILSTIQTIRDFSSFSAMSQLTTTMLPLVAIGFTQPLDMQSKAQSKFWQWFFLIHKKLPCNELPCPFYWILELLMNMKEVHPSRSLFHASIYYAPKVPSVSKMSIFISIHTYCLH